MNNKTKFQRLINSFTHKITHKITHERKGQCTPELCETLDGRKGSACCKLGYKCPMLNGTSCGIYKIRPRNCRSFPANKEDLKLVKNCGFYFE